DGLLLFNAVVARAFSPGIPSRLANDNPFPVVGNGSGPGREGCGAAQGGTSSTEPVGGCGTRPAPAYPGRFQALVGLISAGPRGAGFSASVDRLLRVQAPERFTSEFTQRAQRGYEKLAAMLRQQPEGMAALVEAVFTGQLRDARQIANR